MSEIRKTKTLVIGLNWLGDVVMSFPALAGLAKNSGEPVDVLTRPHLIDLYKISYSVNAIRAMDTRQPFWNHLKIFSAIRRKAYDTIVIFPSSFRAAFIGFLCGGSRRIGFAGQGRNWLLHEAVLRPEGFQNRHERLLYEQLAWSAVGGSSPADLSMRTIPADEQRALGKKMGLESSLPYVVIAPGAAFGPAKRWDTQRFADLAAWLAESRGWRIVATGASAEGNLTAQVAAAAGFRGLDLGGKTTLRELIVLLSGAELVLANDSGTMHLGGILGRPLVVPVGSTDMTRTGPLSSKAQFVLGESCSPPCRKKTCARGDHRCMQSISVEMMKQAVEDLLDK